MNSLGVRYSTADSLVKGLPVHYVQAKNRKMARAYAEEDILPVLTRFSIAFKPPKGWIKRQDALAKYRISIRTLNKIIKENNITVVTQNNHTAINENQLSKAVHCEKRGNAAMTRSALCKATYFLNNAKAAVTVNPDQPTQLTEQSIAQVATHLNSLFNILKPIINQ